MEPKLMSYITSKFASKPDMLLAEREWQDLYTEFPLSQAQILSTSEVQDMDSLETKSLVYGEVEFDAFHEVIGLACRGLTAGPTGTRRFYDLGSGTGRVVRFSARSVGRAACGAACVSAVRCAPLVCAVCVRRGS